MPQDCFFTTRKDPAGILRMCPICISCAKNEENYFFWEGSKLGYGKHNVVCGDCSKEIWNSKNMEAT